MDAPSCCQARSRVAGSSCTSALWLWLLLAVSQVRQHVCQAAAEEGACSETLRTKCEQVLAISKAIGKTECEYQRSYYQCMLLEGCYYLSDGCRDEDDKLVACSGLCEAEPLLDTCFDERQLPPPEDYHLCPHIPKASVTTLPPTLADFLSAPAIPYTITVWTLFRAGASTDPFSMLPTIMPEALRLAMGRILGLNPLAIIVVLPIGTNKASLSLDGADIPPVWTEQTSFMSFNIHIRNLSNYARVEQQSKLFLLGGDGNEQQVRAQLEQTESILAEALNATIPVNTNLKVSQIQIAGRQGLTREFPVAVRTTTELVTTTPIDEALKIVLWRAWRVRCMEGVVHRWEIAELDLWEDRCPEDGGQMRLRPNEDLKAITSGSFNESSHPIDYAFDGDPNWQRTAWLSECSGCKAGSVWFGLDSGTKFLVDKAFRVACVHIRQGLSLTSQCGRIAVEATDNLVDWEVRGEIVNLGDEQSLCVLRTARDFPLLQCGVMDDGCGGQIQFGNCPGHAEVCDNGFCVCSGRSKAADPQYADWECGTTGDGCGGTLSFGACNASRNATCVNNYCKEDISAASYWRLVCMGDTVGRWIVREVEFHVDGLCTIHQDVFVDVRSSGSYYSDLPVMNAFDGDTLTSWASECRVCDAMEAWVSIHFSEAVVIRCVKLIQDPRTTAQCPRLTLQYSDDGEYWKERYRYGFNGMTVGEVMNLQADMDETMDPKDLDPAERFGYYWRLACMQEMDVPWGIYEFDFFDDEGCSNSLRSAVAEVIHSPSASWPAANAYDQSDDTIWVSKCGRCDLAETFQEQVNCKCQEGEAYIGLRFKRPVIIRCVVASQLTEGAGLCPVLGVHFSDNINEVNPWTLRTTSEGNTNNVRWTLPGAKPKNEFELVRSSHAIRLRGALATLAAVSIQW
eukprot:TRINITY_DN62565_c0_g1_i1.p1 TRINITY_DN62565_c0_g1~~TRINITY_DN62565_c0_g1_i1.p1  ORF type:complete len:909 (+),score=140.57 TRINITY_DN62565_c0_g1_i1:40-2766(+)